MGSKSSPSVPVCSHSPDAVPIDSSVHKVFFECGSPCLCWPTSFPATSTRSPWHSTIRPGGMLMMWPAIRSRLSATMSCNLRCPVRFNTSMFNVMRSINPRFTYLLNLFFHFCWQQTWKNRSLLAHAVLHKSCHWDIKPWLGPVNTISSQYTAWFL